MSGGEAVLLGLAAQFVGRPDVLPLDEATLRQVRAAESDVRRQQRELAEASTKVARRRRYGEKLGENKAVDRAGAADRKRQAQVTAGKDRATHQERLQQAQERLAAAAGAVRDDREIRVDLPDTAVPAGRTVLTLSTTPTRWQATWRGWRRVPRPT